MPFRGWPVEAVEFYEGLAADNSKPFWLENKSVFESVVRAPMESLLADLAEEFGTGRIFRPYRDVRFSKDKRPYKLNLAAHLPAGYISFSADGLFVGSGLYLAETAQLARLRAAIDDDGSGSELESILSDLRAWGGEIVAHGQLKTAPRGYPKDHPRIELLRQKGMTMSKSWSAGPWLGTVQARDRVVDALRRARPLNAWLDRYVG
ncbi:MAG TPA: DUF2461 domain-containing protein [Acidimicrobiales bacterium]|jgi:uncharacterized protein (TIGR02453 family)|nr:DUF2461 domain-containing protein [Acidimicrobiales bacterium]